MARYRTLGFFGTLLVLGIAGKADAQRQATPRHATPPESIQVTPGFQVELLRSAQESESSWISLSIDDRGRIFLGLDDQGAAVLERRGAGQELHFQRLQGTEDLRHLRGILYAHESLYLVATDSQALWRCFDRDGDGQFEQRRKLLDLPYQSRYGHGPNQITLGADGMLYLVVGNDVQLPEKALADSPYQDPREDWLLPNPHDLGHDDRVGYIAQMDPDAESITILAGGFRNQVDVAINRQGDLFTWDADMEWDAGLPWYRPTRLNHVIAGGEYGWRWGTGKWPAFFPDSLPTTLDTGFGSPTGLLFGYDSQWPEQYRESLFMADWQHGRVWRVELEPRGASYVANAEIFLEGTPLNVCDLAMGPDGAMYFITGGRGSQSGLYRVTWTGKAEAPEPAAVDTSTLQHASALREKRRQLEALQRRQDPAGMALIVDALASEDLWLRFSARIALENQPLETWSQYPLSLPDAQARRMAAMALARRGQPEHLDVVLESLMLTCWAELSTDALVETLRTTELALIRLGEPNPSQRTELLTQLQGLEQGRAFRVNWLIAELLIKLDAPDAVARLVALLENAATQEEQVQFAKTLMHAQHGWTRETSTAVVAWLQRTRGMRGGHLVGTIWQQLRDALIARIPQEHQNELAAAITALSQPMELAETLPQESRPLVQHWTVDMLLPLATEDGLAERDAIAGMKVLASASCLSCHRWEDRGTHTGPELTLVGRRYDTRALLESILNPHAQVDPKYALTTIQLIDGTILSGRATGVNDREITLETDAMTGRTVVVKREEIELSLPTTRSPMPEGLLDTFNQDEILDLLALLRFGQPMDE